mmetsp:Transcript_2991/g.7572  ORF Transcript_2991/g.7572 Transcript_2991/m.7572 type:complete len:193 (+) Transcript_2991:2-580(+)
MGKAGVRKSVRTGRRSSSPEPVVLSMPEPTPRASGAGPIPVKRSKSGPGHPQRRGRRVAQTLLGIYLFAVHALLYALNSRCSTAPHHAPIAVTGTPAHLAAVPGGTGVSLPAVAPAPDSAERMASAQALRSDTRAMPRADDAATSGGVSDGVGTHPERPGNSSGGDSAAAPASNIIASTRPSSLSVSKPHLD